MSASSCLKRGGLLFALVITLASKLAAQSSLESAKPRLQLVTLGHADHGKTTLTAAITAMLARNRLAQQYDYEALAAPPQEQAFGVAFNVARVEYETPLRRYAQADFPTHADFIRGLLTGAVKMNAALLVVSAVDGPMPQTREQLLLARQLGVSHIVVFLNKLDLVSDPELLAPVETELRLLLKACDFPGDDVPIIRGSALDALKQPESPEKTQCLNALLEALDNYIPLPAPATDKPFLLAIEDVFTLAGRGLAITGRIEQGRIKVGEEVELVGFNARRKTVVVGLEKSRQGEDAATAGEQVAVLLRGVAKSEVARGMVLAAPGSIAQHTKFYAAVYVFKKEEGGRHTPFFNGYRPQFYFRTTAVTGAVTLPAEIEMVMPGDMVTLNLELISPIAMNAGLRFALREAERTVGLGVVTKVVN